MTVTSSVAARTAKANADLTTVGNGATLTVYSGARPATPDTAPVNGTNAALAVLTQAGALGSVTNGVLNTNAFPSTTALAAAGSGTTAVWARLSTSGGVACFDYDVSVTGGTGEVQFPSVTFVSGVTVTMAAGNMTEN